MSDFENVKHYLERCQANEGLSYYELAHEMGMKNANHLSAAIVKMGLVRKIGRGKWVWNATKEPISKALTMHVIERRDKNKREKPVSNRANTNTDGELDRTLQSIYEYWEQCEISGRTPTRKEFELLIDWARRLIK